MKTAEKAKKNRSAQYTNAKRGVVPYFRKPHRILLTDEEQRKIDEDCREREWKRSGFTLAPCRSLTKKEIRNLVKGGEITPIDRIPCSHHSQVR